MVNVEKEDQVELDKDYRNRGWFIERTYVYDRDDVRSPYQGFDEESWIDAIRQEWTTLLEDKRFFWGMFIVHDKDFIKDKNTGDIKPKGLHMHAVVRYKDGKTQSTAMRDFCGNNNRFQHCRGIDSSKGGYSSALLYLTHHTVSAYREYKTWYHHTDVYQVKESYLKLIAKEKADKANKQEIEDYAKELCDKVGTGEIKVGEAKRLFRERAGAYVAGKYKPAFEAADALFKDELIALMQRLSATGQFRKITTYVSGSGRIGKTLLAESLAVDLHGADDVYVPATGGSEKLTDDFVDLFQMQKATVFSDIDPNTFLFKALLNMLDPYKWSPSKSRNKSKPWTSTHVYFADNKPVGEFLIRTITKGEKAMALNHDNAMDLIMGFGRFGRLVTYGHDANGNTVVWLGQLKSEFPTTTEVIEYAENMGKPCFDSSIVGAFYDIVGCVPYDKTAPIIEDRKRMASIINKVYAGDMQAEGFVPTAAFVAKPELVVI